MKFQLYNIKALAISCLLALIISACANTNRSIPQNVDTSEQLTLHFSTEAIATTGRTRVTAQSIDFSWPGISFESEISSSTIGVRLMGPSSYFNVYIDGKRTVLQTNAGEHDYVLAENLSSALHTVKLVKRGETHEGHIKFKGWLTDSSNKSAMSKPLTGGVQKPKIQFFTDSLGVGFGNESPSRECSNEDIARYTNHELAFPSVTAAYFNAESSSQSYSGLGVVRNWGGYGADQSFTRFTHSVLLDQPEIRWAHSQDRADLIVIELGFNDFSEKLNSKVSNERWSSEQELQADWKKSTTGLIAELREVYGKTVPVIFLAAYTWPDDTLRKVARPLFNTPEQVNNNIHYLDISGEEPSGCQWHPNVSQHQSIADKIIAKVQTLDLKKFQ